nr:retrovirus-related Pol polyprotein from transposon TNT 1-94 [Tanacetum cinerariifolium]GFA22578.1 retrovirus-related Pol polyprotein from transposon TNT 1-94 [Tanacetum cinerariifolium]
MYKDTLKDYGVGTHKSVEELQVEVELPRLSNRTLEKDHTDQEDGNDENTGNQETNPTSDLTDYQLVQDREPRTRTKPLSSKWKAVMEEEMDSLRKNKTWELVDHPAGQKLVSCKWLFKIKEGIKGVQRPRYKARLVARRFTQTAGIDYNEVFFLVVRHTSIQIILALTACKDFELEQLDVKTAFLHGNLEEVIYMRQPPGYKQVVHGNLEEVIYMRQPPGYKQDDTLIDCKSKAEIGSTETFLKREFDMKELEEAKKFLNKNGKSVQMPLGGNFKLSLKDCLVRDCDVKRINITYAVSIVSKYLANPGKNQSESMKWILKYLRGTANVGLVYGTNHSNHVDVTGFVDSDYAKDTDKGRSITGYAFLVYGCVVSWKATLQHVVALLTTEAEYMALTEAMKEPIWLRGLLEELGTQLNRLIVNCDNQGAIHLSKNHVFHERTNHTNVCYHFIREVLKAKTVKVLKVGTKHNDADALTNVEPGHK